MSIFTDYPFLSSGARALVTALWERDPETQQHCKRVVALARVLGIASHLDGEMLEALAISAFFHDVGKIGIPDRVLLKPGRFTSDEMEVMKHHPVKGEAIVKELGLEEGEAISQAVRHHHEYFNGEGYPDALAGEAIPIMARIIAVADSYDAMTVSRPYHSGRSSSDVLDIMSGEAGNKLDPYLVNKLIGFAPGLSGY